MPVEDCENNNSQESLEQDFKEKLDLESESRHVQLECVMCMDDDGVDDGNEEYDNGTDSDNNHDNRYYVINCQ